MVPSDPLPLGALVVALAFLPPFIYAIIIRNIERLNREPWRAIFGAFFYGAFFSVLIAIALEVFLAQGYEREYVIPNTGFTLTRALFLVIIVAPFVEEFAKGLGIRSSRRHIFEPEDGIVYGATAGLGFSATENLIYELNALQEASDYSFVAVAALRSITSSFLHATASGVLGYGMARRYLERRMFLEVLPYFALAVLLHAAFNGLAVVLSIDGVPIAAIGLTILASFAAIQWTASRIRHLDRERPLRTYLR